MHPLLPTLLFRQLPCSPYPHARHDTLDTLSVTHTHTVPPNLTDLFPNIPLAARAAEDDELPGGPWSPLLIFFPVEDGQ